MKSKKISSNENEEISSLSFELFKIQQKEGQNEFWHYTSIEAILSIFAEYINNEIEYVSECNMRASNIRFLNDSKEFEDGVDIYRNHKKNCNENDKKECVEELPFFDDIFLISFCGEGDILSQWKWYGKKSGISICFSPEHIMYKRYSYIDNDGQEKKTPDGQNDEFFDPYLSPLKIYYKDEDKINYLNKLKNNDFVHGSLSDAVLESIFIPFCKDEGFIEEKESRLTFFKYEVPSSVEFKAKFDIKYVSSYDGKIKPVLNVKMKYAKNRENVNPEDPQGNIISKIIVGPGIDQENIFNVLIRIFDRNNYSYHNQKDDANLIEGPTEMEDFLTSRYSDGKLHKIIYNGKKHVAYRCQNGIIIMKSSIPFRG